MKEDEEEEAEQLFSWVHRILLYPPCRYSLEEGYNVTTVVTQPDRPKGRKRVLTPTPVKVEASLSARKVNSIEAQLKRANVEIRLADLEEKVFGSPAASLHILPTFKEMRWLNAPWLVPPVSGDMPHRHRNRRRSNRRASASAARRTACSRKGTHRRQSASSRSPDTRTSGT